MNKKVVKPKRVKPPVIAVYTSKDFQHQFLKDADSLGISVSALGALCLKRGYKTVVKKLMNKKTSTIRRTLNA
jgi:hypothetical protein